MSVCYHNDLIAMHTFWISNIQCIKCIICSRGILVISGAHCFHNFIFCYFDNFIYMTAEKWLETQNAQILQRPNEGTSNNVLHETPGYDCNYVMATLHIGHRSYRYIDSSMKGFLEVTMKSYLERGFNPGALKSIETLF